MSQFLVTAPTGQKFKVNAPEGATQEQALAYAQQQFSTQQKPVDSQPAPEEGNAARTTALAGRAVGEGVLGTLASSAEGFGKMATGGSAQDAVLEHYTGKNAMQHDIASFNKTFGTEIPEAKSLPELLTAVLTKFGAPTPETSGERLGYESLKAGSGALTLGGGGAANAARTAIAGASGGASSELARQQGASPAVQTVAGLVGGLVPGAIEGTVTGATRLASNAVRPLTRSGQQDIAANILGDNASDAQTAAANLRNAQEIVPGSARTAGEASQDLGLLSIEKGVRGRNSALFAERAAEQNAARQAELTRLGGTPQDILSAKAARDTITKPLREQAFAQGGTANTAPVHAHIDQILSSPSGRRESVSAAMKWAKDRVGNETDPAALYEIRKDLQLAQRGKLQPSSANAPNAATLAQARSELGKVVEELDNSIENAAPGFQAYLKRYADLSKPIDQKRVIQEIQRRAETTALDVTSGETFLGSANFSRALDSALAKDNKLTATQVRDLNAVRTDLQLGQGINQLKAPGSDTFQNLSIAQALGAGPKGAHPILRVLTKPLEWIYKAAKSDERVNEILAEAMLDPKVAEKLLDRATPASLRQFSNVLKRRLAASGLGAVIAANSKAVETSEDRNTPER